MKVYVSSTFVDLKDYRTSAIRVLRQLGHEVVAMEDYVADSAIPLEKVLEDVRSSDAYVGIFAWRYGYIPGQQPKRKPTPVNIPEELVLPDSGSYGSTSITEWEYLQAKEDPKRPILAFLLEEGVSWPPHMIDGFDPVTSTGQVIDKGMIRDFRERLQRERLVAYFKSPEDLEARVSAAITTVNMSEQVAVNLLDPDVSTPESLNVVAHGEDVRDSAMPNFVDAIVESQADRVIRIDISTEWWSTRLYLLAVLVDRLTDIRRILVLEGNQFVGLLSTDAIKSHMGRIHKQIPIFARKMGQRQNSGLDLRQEAEEILRVWNDILPSDIEFSAQKPVTKANLKWWFGDAMLSHALSVTELASATAFDIARLLDFPSDYVPIITAPLPEPAKDKDKKDLKKDKSTKPKAAKVVVVDKIVLNSKLARSYLNDLLNRAGIRT